MTGGSCAVQAVLYRLQTGEEMALFVITRLTRGELRMQGLAPLNETVCIVSVSTEVANY